jgi:predicted DNA-binding ribbon-helix-helix protein
MSKMMSLMNNETSRVPAHATIGRAPQRERGLKSGNVVVNGHRTSIRLEPEMWSALSEIALSEGIRVNEMVSQVASKSRTGSLTSAVRVFIMAYFRSKANA